MKSLKSYIGRATGKIKKPVRGVIAPASLKILGDSNWGEKRTKDKNRHEAFRRRSEEITEFLSNPEQAIERIFEVKKRPKDKPLTIQIRDIACLEFPCGRDKRNRSFSGIVWAKY